MKGGLILASLLVFAVVVSGCTKVATDVTPAQKIAALGKPGTVMIYTEMSGTVEVPYAYVDDETGELVPLDQTYSRDVSTGLIGSGFIVSSDGYVVTNAHVVSFSDDVLVDGLISAAIDEEIASAEANGGVITQDALDTMTEFFYNYAQVSNVEVTRNVIMGLHSAAGTTVKSIPADLRKAGEPSPGKDIAIIKMDGTNYPTVKLGDSGSAKTGDSVYVLGYPGVATFHPYISEESVTEPSLTSGLISARKQMAGGFDVLQIDAAITHGNSGGPVFNKDGEVIGIATFGSVDYSTWQEIEGFNFIMPSNLAKEFMSEINVQNKRGAVDTHYETGMEDLWDGNYDGALTEFQIVKNLFAAHPYVDAYIKEAQEKRLGISGGFLGETW